MGYFCQILYGKEKRLYAQFKYEGNLVSLTQIILLDTFVFLVSYITVRIVKKHAKKYGWVAKPRQDRWHKEETALHGGVGFIPWIIIGILFTLLLENYLAQLDSSQISIIRVIASGATILFIAGLVDDFHPLHPRVKFLIQLIPVFAFIYFTDIFEFTPIPFFNYFIAGIWIVGIVNAVNLLDNMDGLSSGIVLISSFTLIFISVIAYPYISPSLLIASILASGLLGFIIHNYPPASIFMGDSGSLPLGFIIAILSFPNSLNSNFYDISSNSFWMGFDALMVSILILTVPILDTTFVTVSRLYRSVKISQGGRDHTSHMLVQKGFSERVSILILFLINSVGGLLAILAINYPHLIWPVFIFYSILVLLFGLYLGLWNK
jgi:UDP-GlcNAc:undecaprenyl-phosphate/decaprenyl-phosphate GlcNAc-1-phosphate transferase